MMLGSKGGLALRRRSAEKFYIFYVTFINGGGIPVDFLSVSWYTFYKKWKLMDAKKILEGSE